MNLTTLVMLSVIFNLSFNVVVSAGIAPTTGGLPTPSIGSLSSLDNITWPTIPSVQKAAGCGSSNIFATFCTDVIGLASSFWATALTFGVFMWGVVNVLPQLATAILIPGAFLTYYGVASQVVFIYSTAFAILYLFWAYTLWTGRYNANIE